MNPAASYRAVPMGELACHDLGGLSLIYHRRSGQTHMLVSPATQILAALADTALDMDGLIRRLARDYDLGDPDEARDEIGVHLDMLADAGLIQRL